MESQLSQAPGPVMKERAQQALGVDDLASVGVHTSSWVKVDIFPAEKVKVVAQLLEEFDKQWADDRDAASILQAPETILKERLLAKYAPPPPESLAAGAIEAGGNGTAVEDETEARGAQPLETWIGTIEKQEAANDINVAFDREVRTRMTAYYATASNTPLLGKRNLSVKVDEDGNRGRKGPKACLVLNAEPGPDTELYFGGRVVDELVAANVPRQFLLPLGKIPPV